MSTAHVWLSNKLVALSTPERGCRATPLSSGFDKRALASEISFFRTVRKPTEKGSFLVAGNSPLE
jgi:hypothetical protein